MHFAMNHLLSLMIKMLLLKEDEWLQRSGTLFKQTEYTQ